MNTKAMTQSNQFGLFRILIIVACLARAVVVPGATYYVATTGNDGGAGSAAAPWRTISNALFNAVDDDVVLVSNGTFDLTAQLDLTGRIHLRGFSGNPEDTIVNANQAGRCLFINNTAAFVSAMTFSNGLIVADLGGGGIRMTGGMVSNCVVTHNTSTNANIRGAGIYMSGGQVADCVIRNNTMADASTVPDGGGIYLTGSGLISGCSFWYNKNRTGSGSGHGVGVFLNYGGTVENCEFTANMGYSGTLRILGYGVVSSCLFVNNTNAQGVIHTLTENALPAIISNCSFISNVNTYSTIWLDRSTIMEDCDLLYNTVTHSGFVTLPVVTGIRAIGTATGKTNLIRRCRIMHNRATYDPLFAAHYGAAVWISSNTLVENCLIADNNKGGVYVNTNAANVVLSSCTIASNGNYGVFFDNMAGFDGAATNCIVYYNDVDVTNRLAAGTNFYWYCCASNSLPAAQGNISDDPSFTDISADDYRLGVGSPCINRGTNLPWMTDAVDLDGNKRIMRGLVDMGAYESFPPVGTIYSVR